MKTTFLLLLTLLLPGCAVLQATPWDWLDRPEDVRWVRVSFQGPVYSVSYSIPDRLGSWGNRVAAYPELPGAAGTAAFESPARKGVNSFEIVANYLWDTYWTGFLGGNEWKEDFTFTVYLVNWGEADGFMEMTSEQWVEWHLNADRQWFEKFGGLTGDRYLYFVENLVIEKRVNKNGVPLIFSNNPTAIERSVDYMIPVTNDEYLSFRFFVREKRYGNRGDREWNRRRWEIVQQIVDSIEVTPRPAKF